MKKFLSVVLAVIIALSAFSLNAFAFDSSIADSILGIFEDEQPSLATQATVETDTDAEIEAPDPEEPEETQTRYAAWCANLDNYEEVKYSLTSNYNLDAELCIKGDAASYELNYSGIRIKIIQRDNKSYLYFVNFPFFYAKVNEATVSQEDIINLFCPLLGTFVGAKEENGYYIEEYDKNSNGFTALCYFKGDKLEKLENFNPDTGVKESATFSYSVKDSEVSLPWYAIDMTPLVQLILFLLIFS